MKRLHVYQKQHYINRDNTNLKYTSIYTYFHTSIQTFGIFQYTYLLIIIDDFVNSSSIFWRLIIDYHLSGNNILLKYFKLSCCCQTNIFKHSILIQRISAVKFVPDSFYYFFFFSFSKPFEEEFSMRGFFFPCFSTISLNFFFSLTVEKKKYFLLIFYALFFIYSFYYSVIFTSHLGQCT